MAPRSHAVDITCACGRALTRALSRGWRRGVCTGLVPVLEEAFGGAWPLLMIAFAACVLLGAAFTAGLRHLVDEPIVHLAWFGFATISLLDGGLELCPQGLTMYATIGIVSVWLVILVGDLCDDDVVEGGGGGGGAAADLYVSSERSSPQWQERSMRALDLLRSNPGSRADSARSLDGRGVSLDDGDDDGGAASPAADEGGAWVSAAQSLEQRKPPTRIPTEWKTSAEL